MLFKGIPFLVIGNPINILKKHDKVIIGSEFKLLWVFSIHTSFYIMWLVFSKTNFSFGSFADICAVVAKKTVGYFSKQDGSFICDDNSNIMFTLVAKYGITSFYKYNSSQPDAGVGYSPPLDKWFAWNDDATIIRGFGIGDKTIDQKETLSTLREAKHQAKHFAESIR